MSNRVAKTDRTIRDIDFTASNVGIGKKLDAKLKAAVFGEEQDVELQAKTGELRGSCQSRKRLRRHRARRDARSRSCPHRGW
jgi:hypothetical protein